MGMMFRSDRQRKAMFANMFSRDSFVPVSVKFSSDPYEIRNPLAEKVIIDVLSDVPEDHLDVLRFNDRARVDYISNMAMELDRTWDEQTMGPRPSGHIIKARLERMYSFSMKPQEMLDASVDEFGLTENPFEAGFILPNGHMLDFSDKRYGGRGGNRPRDHSEIAMAYEEYEGETPDMGEFVQETGAISVGITDTQLNLRVAKTPSPQQMEFVLSASKGRDTFIDKIKDTEEGYTTTDSAAFEAFDDGVSQRIKSYLDNI